MALRRTFNNELLSFSYFAGAEVAFSSEEYVVAEGAGTVNVSVGVVNNVTLDRQFQLNITIQPGNGNACRLGNAETEKQ